MARQLPCSRAAAWTAHKMQPAEPTFASSSTRPVVSASTEDLGFFSCMCFPPFILGGTAESLSQARICGPNPGMRSQHQALLIHVPSPPWPAAPHALWCPHPHRLYVRFYVVFPGFLLNMILTRGFTFKAQSCRSSPRLRLQHQALLIQVQSWP